VNTGEAVDSRKQGILITMLPGFLLVFIGAGIGGVLRHAISLLALKAGLTGFPVATLFVNASGSIMMGVLAGFAMQSSALRLFLGVGLMGGFTTFSAFSLDMLSLFETGQIGTAALYLTLSLGLALAGMALGLFLGRAFS
jgi:fluoride exporter